MTLLKCLRHMLTLLTMSFLGLFIERYYPASRHIEVQVFGNGQGKAIHFGERECSIQRRHQKIIEECPSPFVEKHAGLREKLGKAAISLAESIKYGSAGTIEYLVDDKTGDFFFLEVRSQFSSCPYLFHPS